MVKKSAINMADIWYDTNSFLISFSEFIKNAYTCRHRAEYRHFCVCLTFK